MQRLIKRIFLIAVLTSVGLAALLAITMIFTSARSEVAAQLLGTAVTVAFMSLLAFAALGPIEKKRLAGLAWAGMAATVPACAALVTVIWFGQRLAKMLDETSPPGGDLLAKLVVTVCIPAVYLTIVALLLMPRLQVVAKWVQWITAGLLTAITLMGLGLMWGEVNDDDVHKVFGAMVVLTLAGTVTTQILGKFFGIKTDEELVVVSRTITVVCPRCLVKQEMPMGEGKCCQCKLKFKIEVEEPKCATCGYILHALTRPVCPECGNVFDPAFLGHDVTSAQGSVGTGVQAAEPARVQQDKVENLEGNVTSDPQT